MYFELFFCVWGGIKIMFHFLNLKIQLFQYHLLERLSFSDVNVLLNEAYCGLPGICCSEGPRSGLRALTNDKADHGSRSTGFVRGCMQGGLRVGSGRQTSANRNCAGWPGLMPRPTRFSKPVEIRSLPLMYGLTRSK